MASSVLTTACRGYGSPRTEFSRKTRKLHEPPKAAAAAFFHPVSADAPRPGGVALALLFFLLSACASFAYGQADADLAIAQRFAAAGAPQLVLESVERHQPRTAGTATWVQWESLRCEALAALGRNRELTERIGAFPENGVVAQLTPCFAAGMRAALALQQPQLTQSYAARLLWTLHPTGDEAKNARLAVIDANLAARRGDPAFRAMLRYQQDFQPVDRMAVASWVDGLLDLGMEREALNWLQQLDEGSAAKLALRLRTGLVSPDVAVTQARAALAKSGDMRYWRVIADAGRAQGKSALQIEALEHWLNVRGAPTRERSVELWQSYVTTAQQVGNQQRLLAGDDAAWADYAGRRSAGEPQLSRSVFAYLARNARDATARQTAQLQLAHSLHEAGLDRTALRLFEATFPDFAGLDAPTRYLLGTAGEAVGESALALRLFQGLSAPPGVDPEEWALRIARLAVRSGAPDENVDALLKAYAGRKSLTPATVKGLTGFAQELADRGRNEAARVLLMLALPHASSDEARPLLFALGRVYEMMGQRALAGNYYLRSALLADARSPDATALEARLLAGVNLARAGYREDARNQFQWLLMHSKQAAQLEIVRRELKNL